ncbi:SprT family zinc-dependent metalloprotease [Vibrio sp. qd031]|uniref:SprT family zinc-dependent metalloprotease n=1 Tax=Vibrio sp. qd031 TaxID=1603038 RepID=UPI000A10C4F5|nr:SprT family zinc-dependent metalloprotease [Vibrio sp. qd031]
MKLPSPAQSQLEHIEHCISQQVQKAQQHFQRSFERPTFSFKLRGRAAGKAYLHLNQLRLNPVLFVQNEAEFYSDVIPHEIAHLLVFSLYGRVRPHGPEWQHMMQEVLGVPAHTRHQFDVTDVMGKTFAYRCGCDTHQLTIRRHNKIVRQQTRYRCTRCGDELQHVS